MRFQERLTALLSVLFVAAVALAEVGVSSSSADELTKVIKPPDAVESLQKLRGDLLAELGRLQPTTQPAATSPATQPAEPDTACENAKALYSSLEQLLAKVDLCVSLSSQITELKSPENIEALAKELAAMQQRTKDMESGLADPPPYVSEEQVKRAVNEYDERNQELNVRTTLQTERAKAITAAPQRRQDAAAAAVKAHTVFQEQSGRLRTQLDAAKTPGDSHQIAQQLRRGQIEAGLASFDERHAKLLDERDTILQSQEERRIPVLRTLVARLGDWRNMLQQIRSRSEREQIAEQLKFAERHPETCPPHVLVYWKLRLLEVNAREDLEKRERAVRTRFSESAAAELQQTLANEQASWTLFMESLDRRPSERVRERYRRVKEAIARWEGHLRSCQRMLDKSADEQEEITALIDGYDDQIHSMEQVLGEQVNQYRVVHPEDTRAEEIIQEYAQSKHKYTERVQVTRNDVAELITRLKDTTGLISAGVAQLGQHRSRLYWQYLYLPQDPLWSYRLRAAKAEWASEQGRHAECLLALRDELTDVSRAQWALLLLTLAAVEASALYARKRAQRYAESIAKRLAEATAAPEDTERARIADRLHLLVARHVSRVAPLVWPAATAMVFVAAYGVHNTTAAIVLSVLAFIVAAVLSEALIRTLFLPGKPRQRLLRCSNVVATHYRRWAMALWTATVLLVPIPLVLWAFDWAYSTRNCLWSIYRIVALVCVLAFAIRKQSVLRLVGRAEESRHPRILGVISAAYPALWLGIAGLLVLEVAGYGVLVTYVLTGLAETVGTIAAALLVARYARDLALRHQAAVPVTGSALTADALAKGSEEEPPPAGNWAIGLGVVLFRWGVAIAAALTILRVWGITTVELKAAFAYELVGADTSADRPAVTIGRVLAAFLSVVGAWWASRAVRSVLMTRVYPAYAGLDRGAQAAINTALHYFLILVGLYFALFAMRIPLGALTVVLGTLGLGIGLGLQPLFLNFISGLTILFERHVRVGDLIVVNGELGEVTNVSMRSTEIRTPDGIELVIPNSDLITQSVTNWTLQDKRLRARVPVNVAYGTDVRLVKQLLLDILKRHSLVLSYPPPEVWFMAFGANSLDFEMVAWFSNSLNRWRFVTEVRYEVVHVFEEHDIKIPFPQRTLGTLDGKPLPVQLTREYDRPDLRPAVPRPDGVHASAPAAEGRSWQPGPETGGVQPREAL